MSSPPDSLSDFDLIPTTNSPPSLRKSPLSSSPPTLGALSRSKTAPPPMPPLHPEVAPTSSAEEPLTSIPPPRTARPTENDIPPPSSPETIREHHSPVTPSSALRRTSSSLSTSSTPNGRDKKRLRFTPFTNAEAGPSGLGISGGDVFFPGTSLDHAEEGRGRGRKGVPRDQAEYLGTSDPGTPNLQETADQIRRTLSLASLDQVLALTANQAGERDRLLAQVSRAGKDLVWRDQNEKRLFPRDTERALILAVKRGMRSLLLAFSVRAGVNVLLLLFRTFRRRRLQFRLIWHAIFGPEPFRFGAMIGTFTFLNNLTLHLLRLAPPVSYYRRRLRTGLLNQPTYGPPEREGPEGERRWQSAVAGGVGSLGLLWEAKSRRAGVAQQMFVRGLQGSYNLYTPRLGVHIPQGAVLLFGACCGQIMYAWLCSPETIPKEYDRWILSASRVPEFGLLSNRTIMRQGIIEPVQVQRAIDFKFVTPKNKATLVELLEKVKNGWKPDGAVPCEMIHPWVDSHTETNIRRFFAVFRFMLPVYSALHLIPMLVLRQQHFRRDPLRMLARVVLGITRSCSFLGVFVLIYQILFCVRTQTLEKVKGFDAIKAVLRRKEVFWFVGFSTCLSLFVEEKKRRAELGEYPTLDRQPSLTTSAMYVLPRALESAWSSARKRAWVPIVPFGETILGAAAMAMVMDAYKHQPDALSGVVRRLLFQLVGPV